MENSAVATTALGQFKRSVREEALFLIYKHDFYLEKEKITKDEIGAYLQKLYLENVKNYHYRIYTYLHTDGNRYVDRVLMETCKPVDQVYIRMRWGWSKYKVARPERIARRRMTKVQKQQWDALLSQVRADFWENQ